MRSYPGNKRSINRNAQVVSYLVRHGEASRKEIADELGVTGATLTKISGDLIRQGIVYEKGIRDTAGVGRKEITIDVYPNYCYAVGLDVANRYLRVTLLNAKLELVAMREWKYPLLTEDILDQGIAYIRELMEEYGREKILGLGLLGQGYFYEDQFLSLPIHDIRSRIQEQFDLDIYCMNNIRGMAVAQSFLDHKSDDFLMLHYGPGICTVLVQDGSVVPGSQNKAGEIGHVIWDHSRGEVCSVCGKRGCLESYLNFEHVAKEADPDHDAVYTDYELLEKASRKDGGQAVDKALVSLSQIVNLLMGFCDPKQLLLCGQIFTNSRFYARFTGLLETFSDEPRSGRVALVEHYSEKRWKSPGIVVLNEYFGNNPRREIP